MQNNLASSASGIAVLLLLLLLAPQVSSRCEYDWLLFKDSCYAYFNQSQFWYNSEMACKEAGGHLVSVRSDEENRLVSKLSLCRDVWLGRYARDLAKLTEPSGYSWTDDENGESSYSRHNFAAQESSIHRPLVYSRQLSWYNALYHESHPYVCKTAAKPRSEDNTNDCPSSMTFFRGNCYLLSSFQSNFIEADYFCRNRSLHMISVRSEEELRFINTLDLSADTCDSVSIWLGLVKLNHCHPDNRDREKCYQWTDFSGKYTDFPPWSKEQARPSSDEHGEGEKTAADQNCVTLSGESLLGTNCNEERQFVCKAPAKSLTGDLWQKLDKPMMDDNNSTTQSTPETDVSTKPNVTANPEEEPAEVKEPVAEQERKNATTGEASEPAGEVTPAPATEESKPTQEPTAGAESQSEATAGPESPGGEKKPEEASKPESKEENKPKEENAEAAKKSPEEKPSEPTSIKEESKPPQQEANRAEERKPSSENPTGAGQAEQPYNNFFSRLRDALKPQANDMNQGNRAKRSVDHQDAGSADANPKAGNARPKAANANPSAAASSSSDANNKDSESTQAKSRRRSRRSSPPLKTPLHAPKQSAKEAEYDYLVS